MCQVQMHFFDSMIWDMWLSFSACRQDRMMKELSISTSCTSFKKHSPHIKRMMRWEVKKKIIRLLQAIESHVHSPSSDYYCPGVIISSSNISSEITLEIGEGFLVYTRVYMSRYWNHHIERDKHGECLGVNEFIFK